MQPFKLGIIILAAGESSRLGEPKQLVMWHGETLLSKIIREARELSSSALVEKKIVVVLGAGAEMIRMVVNDADVTFSHNSDWQSGMASSIRCGLEAASALGSMDAVLLALCDQPLITSTHLQKLVEAFHSSKKGIVASRYENSPGVPAIFAAKYFPDLRALTGDHGAKKLFATYADDGDVVECPEAEADIDDQSDVLKLKNE